MNKFSTKNIAIAGMLIAMGIVLPFLTLNNPQLGNMFLLMHIPVLIAGFVLGWPLGLIVGFTTPLLRHLFFQAPPMPVALVMAFELATYGAVAGVFYKLLPKKPLNIYVTLIIAMIAGRITYALINMVLLVSGSIEAFNLQIFIAGAFTKAWPGLILQIVLIPVLIVALQKAKLIKN